MPITGNHTLQGYLPGPKRNFSLPTRRVLKISVLQFLHTFFHRSLPLGEANITVKFIKIGRQIATMEARIFDKNEKLVATLMHTAVNFSIPKQED